MIDAAEGRGEVVEHPATIKVDGQNAYGKTEFRIPICQRKNTSIQNPIRQSAFDFQESYAIGRTADVTTPDSSSISIEYRNWPIYRCINANNKNLTVFSSSEKKRLTEYRRRIICYMTQVRFRHASIFCGSKSETAHRFFALMTQFERGCAEWMTIRYCKLAESRIIAIALEVVRPAAANLGTQLRLQLMLIRLIVFERLDIRLEFLADGGIVA